MLDSTKFGEPRRSAYIRQLAIKVQSGDVTLDELKTVYPSIYTSVKQYLNNLKHGKSSTNL